MWDPRRQAARAGGRARRGGHGEGGLLSKAEALPSASMPITWTRCCTPAFDPRFEFSEPLARALAASLWRRQGRDLRRPPRPARADSRTSASCPAGTATKVTLICDLDTLTGGNARDRRHTHPRYQGAASPGCWSLTPPHRTRTLPLYLGHKVRFATPAHAKSSKKKGLGVGRGWRTGPCARGRGGGVRVPVGGVRLRRPGRCGGLGWRGWVCRRSGGRGGCRR